MNTTQAKSASLDRAPSRAVQSSGGPISSSGSRWTSAPSDSSISRRGPACSRLRVIRMRRPNSGRVSNQESRPRRETTSPTTIRVGEARPAAATSRGKARQRPRHRLLPGPGAPLDRRRRRLRRPSARDQDFADGADLAAAHEDHEGPRNTRQPRPVDPGLRLGRVLVAGDQDRRRGQAPVGEGNAGVGRRAGGGRHPGDDLEGHPRLGQGQGLLAAAAEDVGIAALQAHHPAPGAGLGHEPLVQRLLAPGAAPAPVPGVDPLALRPGVLQEPAVDEVVVEHDVGLLEEAGALQGQQTRVSGTGADDVDAALDGLVGMFHGEGRLRRRRPRGSPDRRRP